MAETTLSKTELVDLLRMTIQETTKSLVEELRKPDPEVAQRMEDDRKRAIRAREEMLAIVAAKRQADACTWGTCDCAKEGRPCLAPRCEHRKENGKLAVGENGGQVFSDGKRHPVCLRCGYEFPPIAVMQRDMAGSMA